MSALGQNDRPKTSWMRLARLGGELAAGLLAFVLIGLWVDHHWQTSPWGVLVGSILGLIGGMYNLVKQALRAARESERESRSRRP